MPYIKSKHLRKQARPFKMGMYFLGTIIVLLAWWLWMMGGSIPARLLIIGFLSVFFLSNYNRYKKIVMLDKLVSHKTLDNYLKINKITDIRKIHCVKCLSDKISNRNHISKAYREFYCSICGESLYYAERKDFI